MSSITPNLPPSVAPPPAAPQQATPGASAPPPAPPKEGAPPPDGFRGSPELAEKHGKDDKHDLSHMLSAFHPGEAPSTEELQNAKGRGKSGADLKKDRQMDQDILDHVCGKGCGCGPKSKGGGDPLKALRERDDEVRKHEMDHFHEAGEFAASGPQYETTTASNGQSYVTGGKVMVSVGEVEGDPEKTIAKMTKVEKAALKPAEPSDQDRRVATEAVGKRLKAERELAEKKGKDGRATA